MKSLIHFDIETTGFDPKKGAEILEIAALKCNPENRHPYSRLQSMAFPMKGIDARAQAINGITWGMVKSAPKVEDVLNDFFSYITPEDIIIGHNIDRFDIPFIEHFWGQKIGNERVDTFKLAKEVGFKTGCLKQEELAAHFGIEYKGDAHRALADVEVNRRVYIQLMKQKQNKLFE